MASPKSSDEKKAMNALVFNGGQVESVTLPIPSLLKNQVLVRVEAAAVSFADLLFVKGQISLNRKSPAIPGIEGSGVVVKNGGSIRGWRLGGKRVAFYLCEVHEQGCWAEYVAVTAKYCLVLDNRVNFKEASFLQVEPLTVLMIADKLWQTGSKALVHTLGRSSLGLMLLRYCHANKIQCINIAQDQADFDAFRSLAAEHILTPADPEYELKLKILLYNLQVKVLVEGEGGPNSSFIFERMPPDSTMCVLSSRSGRPTGEISTRCWVEQNKKAEGFNLLNWLKDKNFVTLQLLYKRLSDNLMAFEPENVQEFSIDQLEEALRAVEASPLINKVVISPAVRVSTTMVNSQLSRQLHEPTDELLDEVQFSEEQKEEGDDDSSGESNTNEVEDDLDEELPIPPEGEVEVLSDNSPDRIQIIKS